MAMILSKSRLRVTEAKFFGNSQTAGNITSISEGQGITLTPDPIIATGTVALTSPVLNALGGTGADTSATGGAGQYVKQVGVGAAFTVGAPAATDLSGILGTAHGGTGADLSATGGTSQYIKQTGVGVPFTVGTVPYTDVQNRIQWVNVVAYGADPTGVADCAAAINAAIAAVPLTGGTVYFPAGTYKISTGISVGDGNAITASTLKHIALVGDGCGATAVEIAPIAGTTTLLWDGAAGGTMLTINGPISGVRIEGIQFNCKGSANYAGTAISLVHPCNSFFSRLVAESFSAVAYDLTAYDGAIAGNYAMGANGNVFELVRATNPSDFAAIGLRVGANTTGNAPRLDVAHGVFLGCSFHGGKNGAGVELRFTDNLLFDGSQASVNTGGTGVGLLVSPPAGFDGPTMPAAITFSAGWVTQTGGAGWAGSSGIQFLPWNDDRNTNPIPTSNFAYGIDMQGNCFGTRRFRDLVRVGNNVNAPAPENAATALQILSPDATSSVVEIDAFANAAGPALNFRRSRGIAGTPTAVQNNDVIGALQAYGYGATDYFGPKAADYMVATETWTDAAQGTRRVFQTTQNTTTTTAERFAIEHDGWLTNTLRTLQMRIPGVMFTQTADATTTPNVATTLFSTGVGTLTLPANFLIPGRTIRIKMGGYVSTADGGAGTKTLVLTLGGVTVATGASVGTTTTVINSGWRAEATITCRTIGGGGTVVGNGRWEAQSAGTNALEGVSANATGTAACNTTGTLAINITFNNGDATGVIKTTWAVVEIAN